MCEGNNNQVLDDKSLIVLSEELTLKIFNTTENIIGKSIKWELQNFNDEVIVTGIIKKVPKNSSHQFDFICTSESFYSNVPIKRHWGNYGAHTYIILKLDTDPEQFQKKIKDFIITKNSNSTATLYLQPYSERYLYNEFENGVQAGGRIEYIYLFSYIGLIILIIACINFMNLFTARVTKRLKEVGIKKAIGVSRKYLIFQYLGESMVITFLSLIIAIVLVLLILPQFNDITGKYLSLNFDTDFILSLLAITFITGIISGSYPAFYISGFSPASILRGKLKTSVGEIWIRKGLVIFQFAISVILIVSVLVVSKQINYVLKKNLGYDKDQIIHFPIQGTIGKNLETFQTEIKKIPGVTNASFSGSKLISTGSFTTGIKWEGKNPKDQIKFEQVSVYYDMIETLGIGMVEGRSFSRDFQPKYQGIIFNEAAIKIMGLTDPIGKVIIKWGEKAEIVGVTTDFHLESLHEIVKPVFFDLWPERVLYCMAKIEKGLEQSTIAAIGEFYAEFNPGFDFEYNFLDKDYQRQYEDEQRIASLSKYFAGIAIIISCLGIFGLIAFTAQRKQKEIGIRKVLGSSEFRIVYLLSKDFGKMILAANLIALPLSYLVMKNWLDSFAYKIELSWWTFALAGVLALGIALLTISWHAIKAATSNPVDSLRNE